MRVGYLARRGILMTRREPMPQREHKNFYYTFQALLERLPVRSSLCAVWHGHCSPIEDERQETCSSAFSGEHHDTTRSRKLAADMAACVGLYPAYHQPLVG